MTNAVKNITVMIY